MIYSDFTYSGNRTELDKTFREYSIKKQEDNSVIVVENGYILPHKENEKMTYGLGGVIDQNRNFVKESGFSLIMGEKKNDWGGYYDINLEENICISGEVIFAGFVNNNEWGHFLIDWSTRLWYALKENQHSKIIFCARTEIEQFLPNIQRLMELGGIDIKRIKIMSPSDRPMLCKKIIIPQEALCHEYYSDNYFRLFKNAIDQVKSMKINLKTYDKIYMTRTLLEPKKEIGEKYIEDFFVKEGYFVIAPEKLTVAEQIYYICNCKEIASIEGSAAHNVIFAEKENIHQIILEKKKGCNIRQLILDEIKKTKTDYVGIYKENKFRPTIDDLFEVEVSKNLMSYLQISIKKSTYMYYKFVNSSEFWLTYFIRICRRLNAKIYRKIRGMVVQ